MRHSRMAIVTISGFAVMLLAGCRGGEQQGGAATGEGASAPAHQVSEAAVATTIHFEAPQDTGPADTTCAEPSGDKPTGPVGWISVQKDAPVVKPDPLVQPTGNGALLWGLARGQAADSFQVHFTAGSPLGSDTYGPVSSGVVGGVVRGDAACTSYKYEVRVWHDGRPDPWVADPRIEIVP